MLLTPSQPCLSLTTNLTNVFCYKNIPARRLLSSQFKRRRPSRSDVYTPSERADKVPTVHPLTIRSDQSLSRRDQSPAPRRKFAHTA